MAGKDEVWGKKNPLQGLKFDGTTCLQEVLCMLAGNMDASQTVEE